MIYEFEGKTEKEAIDNAAKELGLTRDSFDVEIVETQKGGLFKKSFVKIQVHTDDAVRGGSGDYADGNRAQSPRRERPKSSTPMIPANDEIEKNLIDYLEQIIKRMGFDVKAGVQFREDRKLGLKIESSASSILIGKKGKTLDALQLLVNIRVGRIGEEDLRVVIDCENYRIYREESLVRMAYSIADRVRGSRKSMLLEPMNPFDRRLIHTTLNDIDDIETKSEGNGMYKQVRIFYKGGKF
ncbi:MAG: protein jag [Termitinemataceae bacterium]|nr:MAG: protein jag [Termitinemataceae bacterium]